MPATRPPLALETLEATVHALAAEVPERRATTYGLVAEAAGLILGRRVPALAVGGVLARSGGALPWWRVVRADGGIDARLAPEAHARWREEDLPARTGRSGDLRLDLASCLWDPPTQSPLVARLSGHPALDARGPGGAGGDRLAVPTDAIQEENDA